MYLYDITKITNNEWHFITKGETPIIGSKVLVVIDRIKGYDIVTCIAREYGMEPFSVTDQMYDVYSTSHFDAWAYFPEIETEEISSENVLKSC